MTHPSPHAGPRTTWVSRSKYSLARGVPSVERRASNPVECSNVRKAPEPRTPTRVPKMDIHPWGFGAAAALGSFGFRGWVLG